MPALQLTTDGQRREVPSVVLKSPNMDRILVVEDDRAVQKALKRLFEGEGFAVEICGDGQSALDSFRATPATAWSPSTGRRAASSAHAATGRRAGR